MSGQRTTGKRATGKQARRARILDAALSTFVQTGYSGASMEMIASAAGLTKPTLYSYFPGKSALFEAVMARKLTQMRAALDAPGNAAMVPTLHRFAWDYARTVMRPDMLSLARLVIGEAQRFPGIGQSYQASGPEPLLQALMAQLDDYKSQGLLTYADAEMAAQDFWGLILSAPRTRALHDPDWHTSEQTLSRTITNGLHVFFKAYAVDPGAAIAQLAELHKSSSV